ncbi:four helix bundle protein [Chryseobacterium taklimakanense]|uniref:Four helix bundle protein n=2 Tax=Chryseobacterium taklimakanense TaxID=536441 RepID=A0A239X8G1_9FLAO|nr:four helix bundle protein [Chryseobacterium taklimakanense]
MVYQKAFDTAMEIYRVSRSFPPEERYSLTSQIIRSSRSVCGNIAEGWRKRRYPKLFENKLTDADGEATETQNWLNFALACDYIDNKTHNRIYEEYNEILSIITSMIINSDKWTLPPKKK